MISKSQTALLPSNDREENLMDHIFSSIHEWYISIPYLEWKKDTALNLDLTNKLIKVTGKENSANLFVILLLLDPPWIFRDDRKVYDKYKYCLNITLHLTNLPPEWVMS